MASAPRSFVAALLLLARMPTRASPASVAWVVGARANDVVRMAYASNASGRFRHEASLEDALRAADPGADALLLLADAYPANRTTVTPGLLAAVGKGLRLFAEFPRGLPIDTRAVAGCVNRSASGETTTAVVNTTLRSLCAPSAAGSTVRTRFLGTGCGQGSGSIEWNSLVTLDPDPSLPPDTTCRWVCEPLRDVTSTPQSAPRSRLCVLVYLPVCLSRFAPQQCSSSGR